MEEQHGDQNVEEEGRRRSWLRLRKTTREDI